TWVPLFRYESCPVANSIRGRPIPRRTVIATIAAMTTLGRVAHQLPTLDQMSFIASPLSSLAQIDRRPSPGAPRQPPVTPARVCTPPRQRTRCCCLRVPVVSVAMQLVTWNVNSLKARLARVEDWVGRHRPDVLCLQETKLADEAFPAMAFEALGYE